MVDDELISGLTRTHATGLALTEATGLLGTPTQDKLSLHSHQPAEDRDEIGRSTQPP